MITQEVCDKCPIKYGGDIIGLRAGRVEEIKRASLANDMCRFDCHKTIGTKKEKMCRGMAEFLKEKGRPNIVMRLEKFT